MNPGYVPLGTENRDKRLRIDSPRFAASVHYLEHADAEVLSETVLVIRIDMISFPREYAAEGQPYTARWQIKQVGRVNVQIQCGELGRKQVLGVQCRKVNQRLIARDRDVLCIAKRIVGNRLPDEVTRCGIKQRVVSVQNPLKPRNVDALEPRNLLDLAVHESAVVTPRTVKQLVAFYTDRETLGDVFVVDDAVAKIEKPRTSATRYDLLKRVERVKRPSRHSNF